MKPKILHYGSKISFLAIMKKEFVVDIACSSKDVKMLYHVYENKSSRMFSEKSCMLKEDIWNATEVQVRDLALYTHWPVHTKEFWDLLNET